MFILFFLCWLIFNGTITLEVILIGLILTGVLYLFASHFLGYKREIGQRFLHNIPWMLLYVRNLIREVVLAAANVIRVALDSNASPDPVIIEFHSGLRTDFQNVLLANSITLTPGTITVFQEGDFFVVHCLRREYGDGIAESSFVKLLRKLDEPDADHEAGALEVIRKELVRRTPWTAKKENK